MKEIIPLFICLALYGNIYAQSDNRTKPKMAGIENTGKPPKCYIGFSSGVNNPAGIIGIDVNIPLAQNITLDGGGGNSTWGNKLYLGGKYYLRPLQRGWAFGGGLTFNSGIDNFKTQLETVYGKSTVMLSLKPQTNIFLGAYYYWTLGRKHNRIFLGLGRSVRLKEVNYTQLNNYGNTLTANSDRVVRFLAPGGFMITSGFSFAIHNRHIN